MEPFNPLEISLIKTSLGTKLDGELAELLERPLEEVTAYMNELTGIGADERYNVIKARRYAEAAKPKKNKTTENENLKAAKRKQEHQQRMRMEEKRIRERDARENRSRFATRTVDYSQMKTVRIDAKTLIWVPKNMNNEEAIKKYHHNLRVYGKKQHLPTIKKTA